jgi:vacuolar-type H+-ATPase subunit I/STV1
MTGTSNPRWRPAAVLVVLIALTGSNAVAQDDQETSEPKPIEAAAPAGGTPEALEAVQKVRNDANLAGQESQQRIDTLSDETETLFSRYSATLKQIDSLRVFNRQMRELIASQEAELHSLNDQLERVASVGRSVTPLMINMIDAVEAFVGLDVPFLIDERKERIAALRKLMNRADVSNAEKYRNIMEAYQVENEYGRTIEAYRSSLQIGEREVTVDFLRFGRIALVYQSLDESETGVWDQENRTWKALDANWRNPIRQGLRIARKQAAPDLIRLPLPAATKSGGQG